MLLTKGIVGFGLVACSAPERTYLKFMVARSEGLQFAMKIGRKEDMDVADEMISNLVWRRSCNYVQSVPKCTYLQFMVLKGEDWDEKYA